jgi:hypothetical protein
MNNAFAIRVLAKREAIKLVKEDLRRRGAKLSYRVIKRGEILLDPRNQIEASL